VKLPKEMVDAGYGIEELFEPNEYRWVSAHHAGEWFPAFEEAVDDALDDITERNREEYLYHKHYTG